MQDSVKKPLFSVDDALRIPRKQARDQHREFINPGLVTFLGLVNFDKDYVKAQGMYVWDKDDRRYLDFWAGYGSLNMGHNHPEILEAINKVSDRPGAVLQKSGFSPILGALAENLAAITPGDLQVTFFCNSGAEAVEGAIKIARAATGRQKIVYSQNSFHGKTLGALSVTGKEKYQKPFQPLIPACDHVLFGHIHPLEQKLKTGDVAAFIIEPIQGEGGVHVPPAGYLKQAEELCHKYGAYLIIDEVQTGFGRTGTFFACEHEDVCPDIMTMAKSLGGGIMPMGAFITTKKIWTKAYGGIDKCLRHTSTMGGSAQACAAAIAAINIIYDEDLLAQAREKGDYFLAKLNELKDKHKMIKEIRGRGLMIGVEFYEPAPGWLTKLSRGVVNRLSKKYFVSMLAGILVNRYGIIAAYSLNDLNTMRLQPPLIVTYEQIDEAVEALDSLCLEYKGIVKTALKTSGPATKQVSEELVKTMSRKRA